jgi:hypothetical protein
VKRRLIAPVAAALVALALAAPAQADELSDLIGRYINWRGGAAFEHLATVHQTGRIDASGLKGPLEVWAGRDGRSRIKIDLGVVKNDVAVAPNMAWQTNQSGQVVDAPDDVTASTRHTLAIDFGSALRGADGARLSLLGHEHREGRDFAVVRVQFDDADHYDLFLDPTTGALYGERLFENHQTTFQRASDWRMIAGVRMAFALDTTSELPGGDQKIRLDHIELNQAIDPRLFDRPAGAHKARFAKGMRSPGWLDFELYNGNRIYIPARVAGHETHVLLDSGAETTVLDRAWAASIGLKAQGEVTALGTGGADTAGLVGGVDIQLGGLTLPDLTVATIDLRPIAERIGHPLPVVLGNEVFNELVIDIDFQTRRIAFLDPAAFVPPPGAVGLDLTLSQGIRSVPVSVEGRPAQAFAFDLGNGSPLIVSASYWDRERLLDNRPQSQALAGAVGGVHPEAVAVLKSVTLAGVTFHDVPTLFPPKSLTAVDSDRILGNVGLPILKRFRVISDYPHNKVWLVPNAEAARAPFAKDRLGLGVKRAGKVFAVEFVAPGSPAEGAGLKAGDRIALVDRQPPDTLDPAAVRALNNRDAGTMVELTLEDGTVKRVRMADYF